MNVVMEKVDTTKRGNQSIELCKGEIPGARPVHYTMEAGNEIVFKGGIGYYHICILIQGEAKFSTDGKEYVFDGRTSFVSDPEKDLTVAAVNDVQLLELQWDIVPGDEEDIAAYNTTFPVIVPYKDCIQYSSRNSEKSIGRMMIPHEIIPRFAMGSVESYGDDVVKAHAHPMLDQFFFSFPENDMDIIIDDERFNMKGNIILHVPLGSNHGVEVTGDRHMHYMWIDFIPDKEAGIERLKSSHRPTNTVRNFDNEDKNR